jgi:hypothetical protein
LKFARSKRAKLYGFKASTFILGLLKAYKLGFLMKLAILFMSQEVSMEMNREENVYLAS